MNLGRFKVKKLLTAEMALLISSVLIFRGLWHLMDKVPLLDEPWVLVIQVAAGVLVSVPALRAIIKQG